MDFLCSGVDNDEKLIRPNGVEETLDFLFKDFDKFANKLQELLNDPKWPIQKSILASHTFVISSLLTLFASYLADFNDITQASANIVDSTRIELLAIAEPLIDGALPFAKVFAINFDRTRGQRNFDTITSASVEQMKKMVVEDGYDASIIDEALKRVNFVSINLESESKSVRRKFKVNTKKAQAKIVNFEFAPNRRVTGFHRLNSKANAKNDKRYSTATDHFILPKFVRNDFAPLKVGNKVYGPAYIDIMNRAFYKLCDELNLITTKENYLDFLIGGLINVRQQFDIDLVVEYVFRVPFLLMRPKGLHSDEQEWPVGRDSLIRILGGKQSIIIDSTVLPSSVYNTELDKIVLTDVIVPGIKAINEMRSPSINHRIVLVGEKPTLFEVLITPRIENHLKALYLRDYIVNTKKSYVADNVVSSNILAQLFASTDENAQRFIFTFDDDRISSELNTMIYIQKHVAVIIQIADSSEEYLSVLFETVKFENELTQMLNKFQVNQFAIFNVEMKDRVNRRATINPQSLRYKSSWKVVKNTQNPRHSITSHPIFPPKVYYTKTHVPSRRIQRPSPIPAGRFKLVSSFRNVQSITLKQGSLNEATNIQKIVHDVTKITQHKDWRLKLTAQSQTFLQSLLETKKINLVQDIRRIAKVFNDNMHNNIGTTGIYQFFRYADNLINNLVIVIAQTDVGTDGSDGLVEESQPNKIYYCYFS